MDALGSYITTEVLKALGQGDMKAGFAWAAVFVLLWFELRGVKKAINGMGAQISKSFAEGEQRFQTLEATQKEFEHRLTVLEQKNA